MTREITSANYATTCAQLICAFAAALDADHIANRMNYTHAALELAASCGWDWKTDVGFKHRTRHATVEELLVEGLNYALEAVRVQYRNYNERAEVTP